MQYFMIAFLFLILFFHINGFVQDENNVAKVLESTSSSLSNETNETAHSINENSKPMLLPQLQSQQQQQRYSSTFITETDIAVRQIKEEEWPILEKRLSQILLAAFKESTTAHLRQNRTTIVFNFTNEENPFTVQILGTRNSEGLTILNFVSFFNNQPIPSEVITADISLLTLSHLSAALQYPVINIREQYQTEHIEESRWWIVGIVLGSGILIILFGWCCLFVYYNSCGRPVQKYYYPKVLEVSPNAEIEIPRDVKSKRRMGSSEIRKHPNSIDPAAAAVGVTPPLPGNTVAKKEELQKISPFKNEVQNVILPISESKNSNNNENLLPTLTGDDGDKGAAEEITEVKPPVKDLLPLDSIPEDLSIERPKSAVVHKRGSTDFLIPNEINTSTWSPYQPGDFIAFTYGIQLGLSQYPRPLPSTDTGVIEFGSLNKKHQLTNS